MLSLLEIYRDPWRFKYRIHGSETALWVGYDLTGKFVGEGTNKPWTEMAITHLTEVAATGQPSVERHVKQLLEPGRIDIEALVLPLASDGRRPDFLISIVTEHTIERSDDYGLPSATRIPLPLTAT